MPEFLSIGPLDYRHYLDDTNVGIVQRIEGYNGMAPRKFGYLRPATNANLYLLGKTANWSDASQYEHISICVKSESIPSCTELVRSIWTNFTIPLTLALLALLGFIVDAISRLVAGYVTSIFRLGSCWQ